MNIKFAVTSYNKFWETTIPILIPSMIESGIKPEDIYVFVGGFNRHIKLPNDYGVNIFGVAHNSIDYTGLISLIEFNLVNDYWFYLHDTCYVGLDFYNKIKNYNYPAVFSSVSVTDGPSMNMGLYSWSLLEKRKKDILNKKNRDYSVAKTLDWKKRGVFWEDEIIGRGGPFYYCHDSRVDRGQNREEYNNIYKTDTRRAVEYFIDLDLYKVKANWSLKSEYEINL
jgi:hypothetical protein